MTFAKRMYIGGELIDGPGLMPVVNPATGLFVGDFVAAGPADVEAALASAKAAFPSWSATTIAERVLWMHRLRDEVIANEDYLRECIHLEMAKSWAATEEDYQMLVSSLNFYADEISRVNVESKIDLDGKHSHLLSRQAVGVVAAFLAWNFPLLNLAYKLGPALAAGCPIILKPSSKTPLSAYAVGELCAKIGLPAGVVNIIAGVDQEIGDALSASTIPALVTLIGSTQTGRHVMRTAATSIKRFSMELGGNAPALVFADADLDLAADIICGVKFANSGQICVSPNRVFVEETVLDEFCRKLVARANSVNVGFDREANIDMGPLMDGGAWARIDGLVQDAVGSGARILCGGGRPSGLADELADGHFYAPTVIAGVDSTMRLYREEIFGPVVSIITFVNQQDVLLAANDTDAGLSSFIFTEDIARAEYCAEQLRFGEVHINSINYAVDLPHCGIKQSGVGVDCSHLALDDYLAPKRISRSINR